jgi:hypothetical protein
MSFLTRLNPIFIAWKSKVWQKRRNHGIPRTKSTVSSYLLVSIGRRRATQAPLCSQGSRSTNCVGPGNAHLVVLKLFLVEIYIVQNLHYKNYMILTQCINMSVYVKTQFNVGHTINYILVLVGNQGSFV